MKACKSEMLIVAFAPVTPYFDLIQSIIVEIARQGEREVLHVDTNDFDIFREKILGRESRNVIYSGSFPDQKIIDLLIRQKIKTFIIEFPALYTLEALCTSLNADLMSSIRMLSSHYASMEPLISLNSSIDCISIDNVHGSVADLIQHVGEALEYAVGPILIDEVIERVVGGGVAVPTIFELAWRNSAERPSGRPQDDYDDREKSAIELSFPPLLTLRQSGICWAPRFFHVGQEEFADRPLELTGRSRTLVFGPYFYLPKGHFRAVFHLNVAQNGSGMTLMVDIVGNLVALAVGKFELPAEGSFEFALNVVIPTNDIWIEGRIHSLEGAIGGFIELVSVRFIRIKAPVILQEPEQ